MNTIRIESGESRSPFIAPPLLLPIFYCSWLCKFNAVVKSLLAQRAAYAFMHQMPRHKTLACLGACPVLRYSSVLNYTMLGFVRDRQLPNLHHLPPMKTGQPGSLWRNLSTR
jgi:hypothetical protein